MFRKTDPIIVLSTKEEADGFISNWKSVALGVIEYKPSQGYEWTSEWNAFRSCASQETTEDIGFGLFSSPELAKQYGLVVTPGVTVLRSWDTKALKPTPKEWGKLCSWISLSGQLAIVI